jgi:hypothetical protein
MLKRSKDFPIFALEHGLTRIQIADIKNLLEESLSKRCSPNSEYFLPWVVYATEVGYEYSGDEYWQTFEERTKNWEFIDDRHFIRECFQIFEKKFRGIVPTGDWANHFSIISRPITNAILPADLQKDLLEILYEIRYKIRKSDLENLDSLGKIIRENSWHRTSRVQTFLQETKLVGQFTQALLLSEKNVDDALISQITLNRIIRDLEKTEKNKIYLRETRKKIEGVLIHGTSSSHYSSRKSSFSDFYKGHSKLPSIKPSFNLSMNSDSRWQLFLKLPEMTTLSEWSQKFDKILNEGRVRIPYSNINRPFPARNLLTSSKEYQIIKWPAKNTPLIEFLLEDSISYTVSIDNIYDITFPVVFKLIREDYAQYVSSKTLEANSEYIFLFEKQESSFDIVGSIISIDCDNIAGILVSINKINTRKLNEFGFEKLESITIKPVCYPYCNSDEVGVYEYSTNERPSFVINSSNNVELLKLILLDNNEKILNVFKQESLLKDQKLLVQLSSELDLGRYIIRIEGTIDRDGLILQTQGNVEICIRKTKPQSPNNSQTIIQAFISPTDSSLEDMWENRTEIKVLGPLDSRVTPRILMFDKNGTQLNLYSMQSIELPITSDVWSDHFAKLKASKKDIQEKYDEANHAVIVFENNDLGKKEITFHRSFNQIRWIYRKRHGKYLLKLLFESDQHQDYSISKYSFADPFSSKMLSVENFIEGKDTNKEEGLYVARYSNVYYGIVISSETTELHDLSLNILHPVYSKDMKYVLNLLSLICLWANAKLTGNYLSYYRQRKIFYHLSSFLYEVLLGKKWIDKEKEIIGKNSIHFVQDLLLELHNKYVQGKIILKYDNTIDEFASFSNEDKVDYFAHTLTHINYFDELKSVHDFSANYGYYKLADGLLCLANNPQSLMKYDFILIGKIFQIVFENPVLLKISRIFTIYTRVKNKILDENLYWGWR